MVIPKKTNTSSQKIHTHMVVTLLLIIGSVFAFASGNTPIVGAGINDESGMVVGVTYYGGNFDYGSNSWIIDNENQCNRILGGEFSAASLDAIMSPNCSDDNGLGYLNDIPLHNTVSYAELSQNPNTFDASALGHLPAGSKLEIKYQGRCVIAEKRDIGGGGGPVNGYPRALDLWWQTARAIGFKNGWDTMTVRSVASSTPLSPLGGTSACNSASTPQTTTINSPTPVQQAATNTSTNKNTKQSTNSNGSPVKQAIEDTQQNNSEQVKAASDAQQTKTDQSIVSKNFESFKPKTAVKRASLTYKVHNLRKITVRTTLFSVVIILTILIMFKRYIPRIKINSKIKFFSY